MARAKISPPRSSPCVVTPSPGDKEGKANVSVPSLKTSLPRPGTPDAFDQKLRSIRGQLAMTHTTEAVWQNLLEEEERAKLGVDLNAAVEKLQTWNAAALYQQAKGVSRDKATLEVAMTQGFIAHSEYGVLRRYVEQKEGRVVNRTNKPRNADGAAMHTLLQQARVQCDLVVVFGDMVRGIFWRHDLCETSWEKYPKSWEFLLKLAQACARGRRCEPSHFGPDDTRHTMSSKKHNLKRFHRIPDELADSITIHSGERDQVYLNLPQEKVRVLNVGRYFTSVDDLLH